MTLKDAVKKALDTTREAVNFSTPGSTVDKKLRRVAAELASLLEEEF